MTRQPVLTAILLTGLLLRIVNIHWGLPIFDQLVGRYHPDEWKISAAAVRFPEFLWTNTDFRYPTFFHLTNAVLFQPVRAILNLISGSGVTDLHVYSTLFARSLSVLAGTGSIYLCYCIGKLLFSRQAGLIAAAVCCLSLRHVINSAYATTDVLTSFFFALLMLLLVQLYSSERFRLRDYTFIGITFGILIGTKYNGGAALILIVMSYGWMLASTPRDPDNQSLWQHFGQLTGRYIFVGAVTTATFVATTPGLLVRFDHFIRSLEASRTAQAAIESRADPAELASELMFEYLDAFGVAILGLFVISIITLFASRQLTGWRKYFLVSCIVMLVAYTIFLSRSLVPRYLIMVVPIVAVTIAAAWQTAQYSSRSLVRHSTSSVVVVMLVASLAIASLGVYSRSGDSRTVAAHFIHQNIPPGTTIGMSYVSEKYRNTHQWRHPVVDINNTFVQADMLEYPEILVLSSYDAGIVSEALRSPYLSNDFEWDSAGPIAWYRGASPSPSVFRFYENLFASDSPYERIAQFSQDELVPISFPAPTITVYELADSGFSTRGL